MDPLFLGTNVATGRRLFITAKQRATHMFVPGRTGTGKTTFLEYMVRQDIRAGRGVCVIDPDGGLYDKLVNYCATRGKLAKRVVLIDPNEEDYRFGLNYFDLPALGVQKKIDLFIEACYKVLGQSTEETKVLFERWGDAAAKPLALYPGTPLTLAELHPLLTNRTFREAVLQHLDPSTFARREWEHFETDLRVQEKNMALLSVLDRAAKFSKDPRMEEILGQPTRIDWRDAMDRGKIVLVNLHTGRDVSGILARMIGVMIIHQIVAAATQRPESPKPRPFYIYVDEFSAIVTEDFRTALKRLRKRGVAFILAQQTLADLLEKDDDRLYHTVIGNTTTKAVFGTEDAQEAAVLAEHIFAPETTGEKIKWQGPPLTQAIPIARSEDVAITSHGSSRSRSGDSTDTESSSTNYDPEGDELITSRGLVHGSRAAWGEVENTNTTYQTQRWTEYEYELVQQAPQFMSVEEELHHYRRRIMRQDIGEYQLKYAPNKPVVAMRSPAPGSREFPDLDYDPELVAEFKRKVYRHMGLLTVDQVRALIGERHRLVLEAPAAEINDEFTRGGATTNPPPSTEDDAS